GGNLGFGARGCSASAVLKIGNTRNQRLPAEQAGEGTDAAIELEIGERVGDVARMTEGNDPTGHRVAHFVDARTNRSLYVIAALCVGKPLPATPRLNHEKYPLNRSIRRTSNATGN